MVTSRRVCGPPGKCLLTAIALVLVISASLWLTQVRETSDYISLPQLAVRRAVAPVEPSDHASAGNGKPLIKAKGNLNSTTARATASTRKVAVQVSAEQAVEYKSAVSKAQQEALKLLGNNLNWIQTKGNDMNKDGVVFIKHVPKYGAIFKLMGTVNANVHTVYEDIIANPEDVPKWDPALLKVHVLARVDNSTEIVYNVAASGGSGFVSSRDFVYARHWEKVNDTYIVSSVSVSYPPAPASSSYVRGLQNPTIIKMREITPSQCSFEWLLNIDLKGSIPRFIVESAMAGSMMEYLRNLRQHISQLT